VPSSRLKSLSRGEWADMSLSSVGVRSY